MLKHPNPYSLTTLFSQSCVIRRVIQGAWFCFGFFFLKKNTKSWSFWKIWFCFCVEEVQIILFYIVFVLLKTECRASQVLCEHCTSFMLTGKSSWSLETYHFLKRTRPWKTAVESRIFIWVIKISTMPISLLVKYYKIGLWKL